MIHVLKSGLLTSIQDLGRYGYQKHGVIASGAMDSESHRIANLLVGNHPNSPTMEITLMGPVLEFQEDTCLAICGGNLSPMIDGERVSTWKPVYIRKGSELRFGKPKEGFRSYLAVAGGFDVPEVMNSASTYMRAGIGGFKGRALQKGDCLSVRSKTKDSKLLLEKIKPKDKNITFQEAGWFVPPEFSNYEDKKSSIRVMAGREFDWFDEKSQKNFFQHSFQIDSKSDRMGYRLTGCPLSFKEEQSLLSEAVTFGTIQVPSEGNPIVLLADRQTTGGYPKIAQVASVDLPRLAQLRPGESLSFTQISHNEAQRLYLQRENEIKQLQLGIASKFR
ncbi:biotin-dependent carboxyltransferase family protein [Halobacillus litoralis]|uniref:5-oxoprolinase subunit C family protein n=1 Tax=Halobacillus litoralis TaxID=45668 RepID=UPI001CFF11DE|nr:biotin-dependent carboxyltransferase family protein [Halobacillus litoralis]